MDKQDKKFLLISGNFFGIQDFIFSGYGDSRKFRSKILRGRSFYVTLLSEMAADMLARAIGLPSISIILNAAGRFTLLAPNTKETLEALERVRKKINDWLVGVAFGEVSMGFSSVSACYEDFSPKKFMRLWDDLGKTGEIPKFQKIDIKEYGGVVAGYTDRFINDLPHPMCPLCGKRPSEEGTNKDFPGIDAEPVCRICRDHVHIGSRLVKDEKIFILPKAAISGRRGDFLFEPLFGEYQVQLLPKKEEAIFKGAQIIKCWDISMPGQDLSTGGVTKKLINSYVPIYEEEDLNDDRILQTEKTEAKKAEMMDEIKIGEIKSLNHIAAAALNHENQNGKKTGIDALGALKADVDNLGMLMACGIDQDRFTLSRLATLSRQFNYYFTLYIPHLLGSGRKFKNVYTVFSGGDDLFLIGPWNRIYELALHLRENFSEYVCRNPVIHFSAGIALQKANNRFTPKLIGKDDPNRGD